MVLFYPLVLGLYIIDIVLSTKLNIAYVFELKKLYNLIILHTHVYLLFEYFIV